MLEQQFQFMLRNAVVVLILMLLALGVADARLPQVGDQVFIGTSSSIPAYGSFQGEITDIGDGFICLKTKSISDQSLYYDICIGVGSIVSLTWV
jgi:hypothetical protein